ncbi:MAG: sterol desaturase family protein [Candidatus Binataceae bacterium]|nr:sterol desaturase family protein [Candidatus Binataceae bacterium]
MVGYAAWFAAGVIAWTFLEYALHGWMSHRFTTFASRVHAVHHRDPSAVFAIGAWLPVAVIWAILVYLGSGKEIASISGLVTGFAVYEIIHYRLHFARPRFEIEDWMRTRHLAHHNCAPKRNLGVSTPVWDLIFGTQATRSEMDRIELSIKKVPPIASPSNLGHLGRFIGCGLTGKPLFRSRKR